MAMTRITLTGRLGALFGKEWKLDVTSPAEAIQALCVLAPGFEDYMYQSKDEGIEFAILKGKKNLDLEGLHHNSNGRHIKILSLPQGAKKGGLMQIFVGIVILVAAFFTGGAALALGASAMVATAATTAVMGLGLSLVFGGMVQMLSPQPKGAASREDPDNKPSYAFGGPVMTAALGNPVPIPYGLREVGGAIISAGIIAEDVRV